MFRTFCSGTSETCPLRVGEKWYQMSSNVANCTDCHALFAPAHFALPRMVAGRMYRFVLLLLAAATPPGVAPRTYHREPGLARAAKRSVGRTINAAVVAVKYASQMLTLKSPKHVYDMGKAAERDRLIDDLWAGDYLSAAGQFTRANPTLDAVFHGQMLDGNDPGRMPDPVGGKPRFESVLSALVKARSKNMVSLETAALSVQLHHYRTPDIVWQTLTSFTRNVMSGTWTDSIIEDALLRDPGCPYPVARGITASCFDNFMINVGYGSYATVDSKGKQLAMTNWATAMLPAAAMPHNWAGVDAMLGAGGIFRTDVALDAFIDLFSPIAPDIVANQRNRWSEYLDDAVAQRIWDKEPYDSPYPPTHFIYHDPIMDRLQSSYEDVNFELDWMRKDGHHVYSDVLMVGGDGLSYKRIIDRISQDPELYLERKPIIIPRLGEAPHGKYHVMHGHWRLWAPLIVRIAAVVGNTALKRDPGVEDFNRHEHFLRIMTRAFAEYVVEIAATGSDYHNAQHFLRCADKNLSFAYICMFLYLFAFQYMQMRTAVRRNDSKRLDLIWRENLATARCSMANKTNYSQMSVILIYWGHCLAEPLRTVFHNTRTLRWLHSHIGWDMPIEKLNMWIKLSVVAHITKEAICKFIRSLNFTHRVVRAMQAVVYRFRKPETETLKKIDNDVELIKEFLRTKIGRNFAEATTPSDENLLSVDMVDWGGNRAARQLAPWEQMRLDMQDFREYVRRHVTEKCPWHQWL